MSLLSGCETAKDDVADIVENPVVAETTTTDDGWDGHVKISDSPTTATPTTTNAQDTTPQTELLTSFENKINERYVAHNIIDNNVRVQLPDNYYGGNLKTIYAEYGEELDIPENIECWAWFDGDGVEDYESELQIDIYSDNDISFSNYPKEFVLQTCTDNLSLTKDRQFGQGNYIVSAPTLYTYGDYEYIIFQLKADDYGYGDEYYFEAITFIDDKALYFSYCFYDQSQTSKEIEIFSKVLSSLEESKPVF